MSRKLSLTVLAAVFALFAATPSLAKEGDKDQRSVRQDVSTLDKKAGERSKSDADRARSKRENSVPQWNTLNVPGQPAFGRVASP